MFRFILALIIIWIFFFMVRLFVRAFRRAKELDRKGVVERKREKYDASIDKSKISEAKFQDIANDPERGGN